MIFKRIAVSLVALWSVWVSTNAFANVGEVPELDLVREVYIKSGLSKQVPALQGQVRESMDVYGAQLPPDVMATFKQKLNGIFDPKLLEQRIMQNIAASVDKKTLLVVLKWFDSPLGQKVTMLEELSSTPEETRNFMAFIEANQNAVFPENRLSLSRKLQEATASIDMLTDLGIYVGVSVLDTLNELNPETPSLSKEQLRNYIESQRAQFREIAERQVTLSSIYVYRTLTDEEFSRYVEVMETPASRSFNQAIINALKRSIYPKMDLES